jgi:SAM-dependent methyltransferase
VSRALLRRLGDHLKGTPLHPQWLLRGPAAIVPVLTSTARGTVLDIGCADRRMECLLPPGCDYLALDFPATGRLLYGARPDVFADASRLPMVDACVDTVLILDVVEHLRFPREALREILRVLRPGGRVLLSVPFLYPIHDAPHDYQRYTTHGLARELEAAGLEVADIRPTLGTSATAGLIVCLALAGIAVTAIERRSPAAALLPLLIGAIPVVNVVAWLGERLLPSWDAMTAGYQVVARKP